MIAGWTSDKEFEIKNSVPSTQTPKSEERKAPRISDCLFVFAVVIASALPYLSGLGFYSDDWAFQANPVLRSGRGVVATIWELMKTDLNLRVRPVQAAYLVLSFKGFGNNPLPYHIAGSLLVAFTALVLYAALIELQMGPGIALAISLLYGLSPQYSTDRFWWASQQAVLCMLFTLIGIYAMLRSLRAGAKHPKRWVAVSIIALVFGVLSYEVAIGLVAAALVASGWRRFRQGYRSPKHRLRAIAGLATIAMVLLAVGIIKSRLQARIVYNHHFLRFLSRLGGMVAHSATESIRFNLWSYCLHLPWVIASLWRHSALTGVAIVSAITISIAVSAYLWRSKDPSAIPAGRACMQLIVIGFALFFLGTFLFLRDVGSDFSIPGIDNRVNIAAALGEPLIWVALAGMALSIMKNPAVRVRSFGVMIGLICGLNCLAISGIAHYWDGAAARQAAILQAVAANVHSLPHRSALLLDGFCRYSGPGIVFETNWDTTGAIDLTLKDDSLLGDVVSRDAQFGPTAVDTTQYGAPAGHYPYGRDLFVYNFRSNYLGIIASKEAAIQYLKTMNPTGDSGCPEEEDGDGAIIF